MVHRGDFLTEVFVLFNLSPENRLFLKLGYRFGAELTRLLVAKRKPYSDRVRALLILARSTGMDLYELAEKIQDEAGIKFSSDIMFSLKKTQPINSYSFADFVSAVLGIYGNAFLQYNLYFETSFDYESGAAKLNLYLDTIVGLAEKLAVE